MSFYAIFKVFGGIFWRKIIEVKIGYDGIVMANSKEAAPVEFSLKDVWTALAKEVVVNGEIVPNPYTTWNEVNPNLPNKKIEVLGPPPTSGTRDAYVFLTSSIKSFGAFLDSTCNILRT